MIVPNGLTKLYTTARTQALKSNRITVIHRYKIYWCYCNYFPLTYQCNAKAYRPTAFHGRINISIYNVECKARIDSDDDDDNSQHFYGAIDLFQTLIGAHKP